MHRPTLFIGLLLILAMCLVPPFETGPVDAAGDVLRGEEGTRIEYHPVWSRPSAENGLLSEVQEWEIAVSRLVLQILAIAALTGGLAYGIGLDS